MAQHNFLTLLNGANKYLPVNLDLALQADLTSEIADLQGQIDSITGTVGGVYSKAEVDGFLALKADKSTTYTKTEVDTLLNGKADLSYVDTQLATKVDITTLDGYYTKDVVDGLLTSVYKFKGSVANLAELYAITPLPKEGDVYNVIESGMNYAFLPDMTVNEAASWDNLGGIIDLSDYLTSAQVTTAINNALVNYYTKTQSDDKYVQNITINGTSVGVTKTAGIVNLDLTSYLAGVTGDITDLAGRVTTLEGDVLAIEGNITTINGRLDTAEADIDAVELDIEGIETTIGNIETAMVTGAKFNDTPVTKVNNELLFSTVLVEPIPATMTLATLNTSHGDKPIGFMLYCTNVNLMTKYVKIGANSWSVEPIFLAT